MKKRIHTLADLYRAAGCDGDDAAIAMGERVRVVLPDDNDPWDHQISGLAAAMGTQRYGLYDEPGVGKTLPAMAYALYHIAIGNKVIVLMPPTLLEQLGQTLEDELPGAKEVATVHTLTQGPAERMKLYAQWKKEGWPDMLMMTYQMYERLDTPGAAYRVTKNKRMASNITKLMETCKDPKAMKRLKSNLAVVERKIHTATRREQDFLSLKASPYLVAVCDEAKALRYPSSGISRAVKRFRDKHKESHLLLMDGTPAHNTLMDLYGFIAMLSPELYGKKETFERTHCVYAHNARGEKVLTGFKKKGLMHRALYQTGRRVLKSDVFKMQPPTIKVVPVALSAGHRALYKKLVKERILEFSDGSIIDASSQPSLRQKCMQMVVCPQLFTEKPMDSNVVYAADEYLDMLGVTPSFGEKLVLFANRRSTVEFLTERYQDRGAVAVYGGSGNNAANIRAFKNDKTCQIMVANPVSGGVGLNLQDMCRYVMFVEPTSVPGEFKQAVERVWRPGQKEHVSIIILKARGTVYPSSIASMLRKEADAVDVHKDSTSMLQELLDDMPAKAA